MHIKSVLMNISSAIVAVMGLSLLNFLLLHQLFKHSARINLHHFTLASLVAPLMLLIKGIMDGFHSIIYMTFMTGLMFGVGLVLAVVTYYLIKWLFYNYEIFKMEYSIVKGSVQS